MGLLHRDKGRDGEGEHVHLRMREKMLAIGDDYWVENDDGDKVFKVDGKAARFRDTWVLEDRDGNEVARIREKKLTVRDAMTIEVVGRDGTVEGKVKKALVGFRDRFHVELDRGEDLKVHGNIVDHEYEIERDGDKIAEVSKRWFRVRDTYGVEVFDPIDTPLVLAVTVAVDAMAGIDV